MKVKCKDLNQAAAVMEHVLRYARKSNRDFAIGPFDTAEIEATGIDLLGDVAELATEIRARFKSAEIVEDEVG